MGPILGVIPVAWLLSRYVCPHQQGGWGGASCMYNTPQNLLTEIQFNAQTLFRRPINVCQSSSLAPTCNRERIGEMKMRKSYVEW